MAKFISRSQRRCEQLAERETIRSLQRTPYEQVIREWVAWLTDESNTSMMTTAQYAQTHGWSKKEFQQEDMKRKLSI